MATRKILVLDTTLRDGEQVPGAKLNTYEKLQIAGQLQKLNVDIIEAGFPASSAGDFEAVRAVAKKAGESVTVTALARAVKTDIDAVFKSVKPAKKPLIHIVLGTSDIHVEKKFKKSKDEILSIGVDAVRYAKTLLPDVQYSTEDASRSEFEYLWRTIEAVVNAGATIVNIPDTVGYAVPEEFGALIKKINERLKNLDDRVVLSVHCHNDAGLATANTLIAVKNGADKVECTINGIGERAGNAALEEVVMGLKLRPDYYGADTGINTAEIKRTSRLVSSLMGLDVQVNKAITGDNAFAHSSGIHQDGLLKSRDAYEVIRPADVGVTDMEMVLTARSGRHAVKNALESIGFGDIPDDAFEAVFEKYLALADAKKEVYNHDLFHIMEDTVKIAPARSVKDRLYELIGFEVSSNDMFPAASVKIRQGGRTLKAHRTGDGAVDALYSAIRECIGKKIALAEYRVSSMTRGKTALGRVSIQVEYNGKNYAAKAVDTDVIRASALAFIDAANIIAVKETTAKE